MQLKAVVLPAPFGPISPTISHSLTAIEKSWSACSPPKRMPTSRTSSTDICRHLASGRSPAVQGEPAPGHPLADRRDELAQAARSPDHRVEEKHCADEPWQVGL